MGINLSSAKRKGNSVYCLKETLNFEIKVNYGYNNINEVDKFVNKYKKILFNDKSLQYKVIDLLEKEKDKVCASMIPLQTDFIWYVSSNKVKPAKFKDDKIIIYDKEEIIFWH